MEGSNISSNTIKIDQKQKQAILLVKSPNESNYEHDEYTRTFSETGLYFPIFVSILKTKIDEGQIDELKTIIKRGPKSLGLHGVVITSSRSVDSTQLALNKIKNELKDNSYQGGQLKDNSYQGGQLKDNFYQGGQLKDNSYQGGQEIKASNWASIPFFVIGTSTYKTLLNLNNFDNPDIFPNTRNGEINILGHDQSGSGFKLAEFIKSYFANLMEQTQQQSSQVKSSQVRQKNGDSLFHNQNDESTVQLLYLTGDPRDSGLSENLINHNVDSKHKIKFNLMEKIVYSIEPESEPKLEPQELFDSSSCSQSDLEIEPEEQEKIEKEIEIELKQIQQRQQLPQQQQEEEEGKKLTNWIVFFSPNSTRIFLNNVNNLLIKTKIRFLKKLKNQNQFDIKNFLLKLDVIKIGVIGPTTCNFINKKFLFNPTVVSLKPNPSALLKSILDFDHPPIP